VDEPDLTLFSNVMKLQGLLPVLLDVGKGEIMAATKSKSKGKSKSRCWSGYEPVAGKKPFSKGSCKKKK
jgi:hypothetical protein